MAGGPGDVREMTTHEFCHSKWFYVGNWLFDHLQWCVQDACHGCVPTCSDAAHRWMRNVCN
ncbi:hypothetical protein F5B20DRAFT_566357, partial [Whalleya microplaca]